MIKTLTHAEAKQLREQVLERFRQSPNNGAGVKISSYKNKYKPLAEHISQAVPGSEASVTVSRLRKFFYDTNPDLRPPDKLETPSFGDDFVRVLWAYVEPPHFEPLPSETLPPEPIPPHLKPSFLRRVLPWAMLLLLGIITLLFWMWRDSELQGWVEDFNTVHPDSLRARGWEIVDYDSAAFAQQHREGHLTLYTHRGDYWYTPPDTPIITNLLARKIGLPAAKITFKLSDFNPSQNWQQAGIILLDKEKKRNHNIRVTLVSGDNGFPPGRSIQMIKREHGMTYDKNHVVDILQPGQELMALPPGIWIQVQFENKRFRFFRHYEEEFSSFIEIGELDFNFEPHYVAVVAFRGLRDVRRELNTAKAIPVCFDYIKVEPLYQ